MLTFLVQYTGGLNFEIVGKKAKRTALIVYNPDLFYNFDEQIGKSFADGLLRHDIKSNIQTTKFASKDFNVEFDLYVIIANTYNFAPDWGVTKYLQTNHTLDGKRVVAITLGAGATERARKLLEEEIELHGCQLMASEEYWLLKPNDESRSDEGNIDVALDMAKQLGEEIGTKIVGH